MGNFSRDLIAGAVRIAFIENDSPIMWSDVERMIYKVITWVLIGRKQSDAQLRKSDDPVNGKYYTVAKDYLDKNADTNLMNFFDDYSFENDVALNRPPYQNAFRKVIGKEFYAPYKSSDALAIKMLDELVKFESIFSNFINQQTGLDYEKDEKTLQLNYLSALFNPVKRTFYDDETKNLLFQKMVFTNMQPSSFVTKTDNDISIFL